MLACLSVFVAGWPPAVAWSDGPTAPEPRWRLPLVVHHTGPADADPEFVSRQLATANRIFAPYGVGFVVTGETTLAAGHGRLENRADRDQLGAYCQPGVINWFVVQSLRDVDEPARMRRGVHWRSRSQRPAHYVIVSRIAADFVLAHELGHFLGNHRHSPTPDNLMSYQHTGKPLFLDAAQLRRMRRTLRRYLRTGELRHQPQRPNRGGGLPDGGPAAGRARSADATRAALADSDKRVWAEPR